MLTRINKPITQLISWVQKVIFKRPVLVFSTTICCLTIRSDNFSVLVASKKNNTIILTLCDTFFYEKDQFQAKLSEVVLIHQLKNYPCILVLQPKDYQLILIDALPVAPAEFQEAIRWKIKDMIRLPLEDTLIDSFPMPKKRENDTNKMITCVISSLKYVKTLSDQIIASGLQLYSIDIQELGLRNILTLFESKDKATALIYVAEKGSQLVITKNGQICFIRQFELGLNIPGDATPDILIQHTDKFALEIQRSLDYFQSQWRQFMPSHVWLTSVPVISQVVIEHLLQRLTLPLRVLTITEKITVEGVIERAKLNNINKYLPLIGEFLSNESDENATEH